MANVVVVGAQWGDEGKARSSTGSRNAPTSSCASRAATTPGTLVIGDETFKLSLLPSGVVRPGSLAVIGNGVVVDPWALCAEIERLRARA